MFMSTDYDGETLASRIEDQQARERFADEQHAEALAIERRECAAFDAAVYSWERAVTRTQQYGMRETAARYAEIGNGLFVRVGRRRA
jgi:hypothetical protein